LGWPATRRPPNVLVPTQSLSPSNAGSDSLAFPKVTDLSVWGLREKTSNSIGRKADAVGQASINQCSLESTSRRSLQYLSPSVDESAPGEAM